MAIKLNFTKLGKMGGGSVYVAPTAKPGSQDYSSHLETQPIAATLSVEKKTGKEEWKGTQEQTQTINPGIFTDGHKITVEGGRTLNLGNYESARISVSITVPCDKAGLNEAFEYASEWVSEKIDAAVKAAKGE